MDLSTLVNLADERLGAVALLANDEFFAAADNLVKPAAPIALPDRYADRGKWMDGWETRRRREPGHDWCLLRLGLPGLVRAIEVDTSYFDGNHPEACSIEGCLISGPIDATALTSEGVSWSELLPRSSLQGNSVNRFPVESDAAVSHVRLNIYPDGGVSRLRVHGIVTPDWTRLASRPELDLAALEHGGVVSAASDRRFGASHHLILPGPALGMHDGWETRRRRGPGNEWAIVRLGRRGLIHRVEVDTTHFKGNAPESCSLDACETEGDASVEPDRFWRELVPRTHLQPHGRHVFEDPHLRAGPATHVRLNIFPDGGVARLRVWGRI
jgi:allantoicase